MFIWHAILTLLSAKFVKCDVTKWEDQLLLFAEAASFTGKIDYVVANAGICLADEVFSFSGKMFDSFCIILWTNNNFDRQRQGAHEAEFGYGRCQFEGDFIHN